METSDEHAKLIGKFLEDRDFTVEACVGLKPGLSVPDPRPEKERGLVDLKIRDQNYRLIWIEVELPMSKWKGRYVFDLPRVIRPEIIRFEASQEADQLWLLTHVKYKERLNSALNTIFKYDPGSIEPYLHLADSKLFEENRMNPTDPRLLYGWYRFTPRGGIRDIEIYFPIKPGFLRLIYGSARDLNERLRSSPRN